MNTTSAHTSPGASSRKPQSFETRIGLYWLHRFGIVSLVFGVAFLIMCSFQYFGPVLKLFTGFAVSSALILLGSNMARKMKSRWFAHGLTAGGWSLAYFSTYAAYYLPEVHIVPSLPLESVLLLGVAGGSLLSALRAQSQAMAIYSVTLAAASIIMSGPSLLSDMSFLIIAVTTSLLGNRLAWRKLFSFGMAACYLGHMYCSATAVGLQDDTVASVFLAAIWLVFSIGLGYSVHLSQQARTFTTTMSCLNATAFVSGLALFSGRGIPETSQLLLAFGGSVYLAAARWLHKRKEVNLSIVHSLLGLSLINVAKVMHYSGQTLLAVDLMEVALLGTVGARFGIRSFRWFAVYLAVALFPLWISGATFAFEQVSLGFHALPYVKLGFFAAIAMGSLAALHIGKQLSLGLSKQYGHFYYTATNLILMLVFSNIIDPSWQVFAYVVQAIVNHLIATELNESYFAIPGILCAYIAGMILMANDWNTSTIALIVISLYAAHGLFRYMGQHQISGATRDTSKMSAMLRTAYAHAANILLTLFIFKQVRSDCISPAIGLEGIGILLAGFLLNDRLFRLSGLAVLAILAGKLFCFDFAKFNTMERVISFTVAGLVFLLSSYGYARFTRSFEDEPEAESASLEADAEAEAKAEVKTEPDAEPETESEELWLGYSGNWA